MSRARYTVTMDKIPIEPAFSKGKKLEQLGIVTYRKNPTGSKCKK